MGTKELKISVELYKAKKELLRKNDELIEKSKLIIELTEYFSEIGRVHTRFSKAYKLFPSDNKVLDSVCIDTISEMNNILSRALKAYDKHSTSTDKVE